MIVPISSGEVPSPEPASPLKSGESDFQYELIRSQADSLLKTTKQYGRWLRLRQNNPAGANEAANLVLERHTLLSQARASLPVNPDQFDALTRRLEKLGIYLYRSGQFRDPVFRKGASQAPVPSRPAFAPQASDTPGSTVLETPVETRRIDPRAPRTELEVHSRRQDDTLGSELIRVSRERYLGRSYSKRDCYTFLVRALEDIGVRYYGPEGLRSELVQKALNDGLSPYRYLTGEAVTHSLTGRPVEIHIPNAREDALESTWKQLERALLPGAVLSISSQTFGHTGIVAENNAQWTFLNSSTQRRSAGTGYRIQEEDLKSELKEWLQRARKRNSFLTITLGVPERRLAARYGTPGDFAENPLTSAAPRPKV